MNARLQECQASGEKSDVLVLLRWLGPTFAELVERPVLDSQERQVLAAFNRVRAEVSGVSGTPGNLDHDRELEAGLSQWFHRALSTHFCEALAETSEVQTSSAAGQRRTKALASSNRRKAREVSVVPTQAEMRQMVRQFRDSLRKANAAEVSDA